IVPPILHHIAIGMKTAPPKQWEQAANACVVIHPHWTRMYWDDAAAEKFIKAEHAWFWETWTNYRFNIQKADSLRYLVLYTYGGTYLDMDLMCRRSLDPLRKVQFLANAAHPVGVSNGFIMVPRHSPFISTLVTNLPTFNHYFLSPYASVMFSTGCMYISALHNIFPERETLKVLGGQQNRLSGKVETPLFRHLGASSWHQGDAKLFGKLGRWIKKVPIF
ncbi:nucleotide-diphospho-sugar transferase, partial [Fimicolochytrium jonesii]|uniref:nucleotide-diphospho-sugar transferase n=1 Tax=Fimicolochytrium jonesii TaxID=1396493 RepID=UPI0022FF0C9B